MASGKFSIDVSAYALEVFAELVQEDLQWLEQNPEPHFHEYRRGYVAATKARLHLLELVLKKVGMYGDIGRLRRCLRELLAIVDCGDPYDEERVKEAVKEGWLLLGEERGR